MSSWKYVMFDNGVAEVPVVFPPAICHITMALGVTSQEECKHYRLVSAGFVDIGMSCHAYGKSETLNISSRPEDSEVISMYPYMHGIKCQESADFIKETLQKLNRGEEE